MGERRVAFCVALICLSASALPAYAQGVELEASAGVGGYARPGRWTPVRVHLSSSRALDGELQVQWGPAHVRRAVSLAPGVARQLELYIRTPDPRDVISVRFVSGASALAQVETPLRIMGYEAAAELIVCGPRSAALSDAQCSVSVDLAALPASWRGFDGVDAVHLLPDEMMALNDRQRRAVELSTAQAPLRRLGLGTPTVGQIPERRAWPRRSAWLLGGFALVFTVVLVAVRLRGAGGTMSAILLCAAAGSIAVSAAGRFGPGSAIVVHHTASIDQFEGSSGALLTLHGVAEFPAFARYVVRADLDDATIHGDTHTDSDEIVQFDASGFPLLSGTFGLGDAKRFVLTGAAPDGLIRVTRTGNDVQLTNVSRLTLAECSFAATPSSVTHALRPGQSVTGTVDDDDPDPTFSCSADEIPWALSETHVPVVMDGRATIVVHLTASHHAATGTDR